MARRRAATPAWGGRPLAVRGCRTGGRRAAVADQGDAALAPELDRYVIAQLVGAVTKLAQFVQTL